VAREDGLRLLLALALSTALHLSLIYGIAVGPSGSVPASTIVARLVSQAAASPAEKSTTTGNRRHGPAAVPVFVPSNAEPAFSVAPDAPAEPRPEPVALAPARIDDSRLPSADVPLLVDPAWYEAKDLDLYPQPLVPVQPVYPSSATDIGGDVTLLLQIDEFGAVQQLSVVTAEPAGYFEEAALHALQLARFAPAQREGRPVRSRIVIKVRFAPQPKGEER
jgi:periplasmic protein TonB